MIPIPVRVWAVVTAAVALHAAGATIAEPQASSVVPSSPARGALLGAYVQPDGWSDREQKVAVNRLEADLGRSLDIDHYYYLWNHEFPGRRQKWDLRRDRTPMISWGSTDIASILDGDYDSMIRGRANGLRSLREPVLLRWFWEMDEPGFQGDEIESPQQFIAAWRRMHDIFVERRALNVEWVWCPNASAFATGVAQQFYPGDAYVDWICADGYNWAPVREGSPWRPFRAIFSSFYRWGASKDQPLMVGETGVLEDGPGDKGEWIRHMGRTLKTRYPEIKALVYFDAYATANFGGWYDWRVDTSASSYDAFKALGDRRYFGGGDG